MNAKRKKPYVLDPSVPYVLAVGNHDPFCNDLQLLMAIYGRDWEALINGAVLFHHPRTMEWLVFDNPDARVRLPDGLLPTTHRFQALDVSRWGWRPARPLP